MTELQLTSPAFGDREWIPDRFSHLGGNISPPLAWSQVPRDAAELLLLCEDPDAPSGTFLHWLVSGIAPETQWVSEGAAPGNAQQWPNDFGETGWGGPQPPVGDAPHRYVFQLHALAEAVQLPPNPDAGQLHQAIKEAQPLASGTLIGVYGR
ncbi:YbhB/YbcL family Raf kinase inhibitor-like protein [Allorhizocola rhizosphaerae]|uniref:YbhB/YbcL family Raf kinase inhibitor-like protein n=1 Tax=Allorhizocola rhizosphaerae TaxID=1872709 RepID=UPI000E3C6099|nr:YbhB/YbcL family Raf kinase inhibitor-like protein [Allorhizocola rhizosphaerae]